MVLWYSMVLHLQNIPIINIAVVILHIHFNFSIFLSFQNEQVPAPRVQLHTQDLDLPRRVHSVPELRQGAAAETQAEDLYCKTGQRSHGSRVGWDACGRYTSVCAHWESGLGRESDWSGGQKTGEWISERKRKLVPSPNVSPCDYWTPLWGTINTGHSEQIASASFIKIELAVAPQRVSHTWWGIWFQMVISLLYVICMTATLWKYFRSV